MLRSIFPMYCLARSACFYACLHVYLSFLHASCFRPCFPMLCSSFCSMLMLGLHAHMFVWCCWLCLAWIYVFLCIFPCYMVRSLSSHAFLKHGFMFFHVYVLGLYMLMCMLYAYLSRSMFSHAWVLGSMLFICFILSSMCLCTPCHVLCLDLDYVCHAMCYCSPFVSLSCVLAIL